MDIEAPIIVIGSLFAGSVQLLLKSAESNSNCPAAAAAVVVVIRLLVLGVT